MPVTILIVATINEGEPLALAAYIECMTSILAEVDARIVSRCKLWQAGTDQRPAQTAILTEFPDLMSFHKMRTGDAFAALHALRSKAYLEYSLHIVANPALSSERARPGDRGDRDDTF